VLARSDRELLRMLRRLDRSPRATAPVEEQTPPPPLDVGTPPIGAVLFAERTGPASARVIGWAQDPDDPAKAVTVTGVVDGVVAGRGVADQPRGDVGPHGYAVTVATDERRHTVCVRAEGTMIGGCLSIPAYGDLDADGVVGCADIEILKAHYGGQGGVADLNSDGSVNIFDLSILLSRVSSTTSSCPAGG
jgi:hypothetical protein